jgi:salicylate hydroxylase
MNIAVIGAGIGGLTFAAAMRRFAPEAKVELYERDLSATSRFQGYSLGLKGDAGLAVLKTLGLDDFLSTHAVTISNFIFCDQRGRVLLALPATGDERRLTRRVKRQDLKIALLGAIGDTPIHTDMLAAGFRQNGQEVEVGFANGHTSSVDYLIACDGVASAIRQQMLGDQKRYLGLTTILVDTPCPIEDPLLEGGYFMTLGDDGTSVFCYRQPDGVHLSYTAHAESEHELGAQAPASLLQRIQHETRLWHQPIPQIVAQSDPASVVVRDYYDKEPAKRIHDGRVWLIGDAAHPMCPFQGQGANMAMVDALKLAQFFGELAATPSAAAAQGDALEREIVRRGRKAVLESRNAANQFHSTSRMQQRLRNIGFRVGNMAMKLFAQR